MPINKDQVPQVDENYNEENKENLREMKNGQKIKQNRRRTINNGRKIKKKISENEEKNRDAGLLIIFYQIYLIVFYKKHCSEKN
jgi:hypothetical protein